MEKRGNPPAARCLSSARSPPSFHFLLRSSLTNHIKESKLMIYACIEVQDHSVSVLKYLMITKGLKPMLHCSGVRKIECMTSIKRLAEELTSL